MNWSIGSLFRSVGEFRRIEHVTEEWQKHADAALALMDASASRAAPYEEPHRVEARRILIARPPSIIPRRCCSEIEPTKQALSLSAQHELREAMRRLARSGYRGGSSWRVIFSDIIPEIDRIVMIKAGRSLPKSFPRI